MPLPDSMVPDQIRADSIAKLMMSERESGMSTFDFWRAITRLARNVPVLRAATTPNVSVVGKPDATKPSPPIAI
jgi:hypothetical protein